MGKKILRHRYTCNDTHMCGIHSHMNIVTCVTKTPNTNYSNGA